MSELTIYYLSFLGIYFLYNYFERTMNILHVLQYIRQ